MEKNQRSVDKTAETQEDCILDSHLMMRYNKRALDKEWEVENNEGI